MYTGADGKCGGKPNHAVIVVGYGTLNGQEYIEIKNSWHTTWGDKGYAKLSTANYQSGGVCSWAKLAVFSVGI